MVVDMKLLRVCYGFVAPSRPLGGRVAAGPRCARPTSSKGVGKVSDSNGNGKISYEEFTRRAIKVLRIDPKTGEMKKDEEGKPYKGIHSRFSGFNSLFFRYFGEHPIVSTEDAYGNRVYTGPVMELIKAGKIKRAPAKGGMILLLPEDWTESPERASPLDRVLAQITNA